jgi:hypothetical protein
MGPLETVAARARLGTPRSARVLECPRRYAALVPTAVPDRLSPAGSGESARRRPTSLRPSLRAALGQRSQTSVEARAPTARLLRLSLDRVEARSHRGNFLAVGEQRTLRLRPLHRGPGARLAAKGMVDRDTRSLRSPSRVLLCMRKLVLLKPSSPCTDCEITSAERIVSLGALPLPGLSSVVFASKALIRMKAVRRTAGRTRVLSRFLNTSYYVVIASGRTENVLIAFGRPREVTQALVVRLARVLAARAAA